MFHLKFPPVLKMAIYTMPRETYLHLATLDSTGGSSAQMRRIWVAGIHKLVSAPHPKPRTLSSLCCVIAVYCDSELELKVICVIGKSTIFLLVAGFVMEKNNKIKGIHMMPAINWKYGNSICRRSWKQSSWAAFRPSTKKKKEQFAISGLVQNIWKNYDFQRF